MRPEKAERRIVQRAQAVLLLADGVATANVAKLSGVHLRTVEKWRLRFSCTDPLEKLADTPRSGRPRALSTERHLRARHRRSVPSAQRRRLSQSRSGRLPC